MKKCVHITVINDYFPELLAITVPLIKAWTQKIGVDLNVISESKFPGFPPNFEKMQIWELGKGYDWNMYMDVDIIVNPTTMPDFMEQDPRFVYYESSLVNIQECFNAHPYFLRDERGVGVSGCCLVSSLYTHDVWHPINMNYEEAKKYCRIDPRMVDEFALSLNIARFGLKVRGTIGPDRNHFHLQATDEYNRTFNDGTGKLDKQEQIIRTLKKVKEMNIDVEYFQNKFSV